MQRRRLPAVSLLALAATLICAAPSGAAIVTGRSIAGVRVGATEAAASRAVGRPARRDCRKVMREGRRFTSCVLGWPTREMYAFSVDKRIVEVATRSGREHTSRGIASGDDIDEVMRAYPSCRLASAVYCLLGRTGHTGDRYTYIQFAGQERVGLIAVGRFDRHFACSIAPGCP